jgi:glycogen operon protein
VAHTQQGNNNTYCQDNELTWFNWDLSPDRQALLKFARRVIATYMEQPVFHRRRFFHGKSLHGGHKVPDITWLAPDGKEMSDEAWDAPFVRCLGVFLYGGSVDVDERGEQIKGDSLLLLFNADHGNPIPFELPDPPGDCEPWELLFDTMQADPPELNEVGPQYELGPCSVAAFRAPRKVDEETLI